MWIHMHVWLGFSPKLLQPSLKVVSYHCAEDIWSVFLRFPVLRTYPVARSDLAL